MIATEFTDEIGAEIIALMQKPPEGPTNCCASVLRTHHGEYPAAWENRWEACYAPTARKLECQDHPDHFGISFFGYGSGNGGEQAKQADNPYAKETQLFLAALVAPTGVFKDVLPHLWHRTPDEIIADHGFVVINALAPTCNPGLLWTFLQAARMIYEHRTILPLFTEALTHTDDAQIALFCALSLWKRDDGVFTDCRPHLHGDALGSTPGNPWRLRRSFLTGVTVRQERHSPYYSWRCFPTNEHPINYAYNETQRPLPKWVKLCEDSRAKTTG